MGALNDLPGIRVAFPPSAGLGDASYHRSTRRRFSKLRAVSSSGNEEAGAECDAGVLNGGGNMATKLPIEELTSKLRVGEMTAATISEETWRMTEPIRLAILGCGAITRSEHIPAVCSHPGVQLVALVDRDLSQADALIRNHGLTCKAVADYREVLAEVDAVLNALPNHLHVSSNMDCLRAGVHVLCEKPLAITAAEARSCAEFAEKKKLVLAVAMNRRFA